MKRETMFSGSERERSNRRLLYIRQCIAGVAACAVIPGLMACTDSEQPDRPTTTTSTLAPSHTTEDTPTTSLTSQPSVPAEIAPSTSESADDKSDILERELFYGESCGQIVETRETNTINMDYVNVEENVYTGNHNTSLKEGLSKRIINALTDSEKDSDKLDPSQRNVIVKSVDALVDETYGDDRLPDNKQYVITVASFDASNESISDATHENDLNYCVYDLSEVQK